MTIGAGAQSFTTQTGKGWGVGQSVLIARTSAPTTTWMAGIISAYNSGTGAMSATIAAGWTAGSGTFTDWTIGLTAPTPTALPVTSSFLTQATARLLGRTTASTGTPEEISVDSTLSLSAGQLKVANAAGLVLLSSATASSSAAIDITAGIDSTYTEYEWHFQNVVPATDGDGFNFRVSTDGGSTWQAGTSYTPAAMTVDGSTVTATGGSATNFIRVTPNTGISGTASNGGCSGVIRIVNPANASGHKHFMWNVSYHPTSGTKPNFCSGAASFDSSTAVNALRALCSSGNIASGTFHLYGVRKS